MTCLCLMLHSTSREKSEVERSDERKLLRVPICVCAFGLVVNDAITGKRFSSVFLSRERGKGEIETFSDCR